MNEGEMKRNEEGDRDTGADKLSIRLRRLIGQRMGD